MFSIGTRPASKSPRSTAAMTSGTVRCGRAFARREVVLGEQRLLGERPRRAEVRDRSHGQIVFGAPERPRRHCPDRCNVRRIGVWSVRVVLTTRSLQTRSTTDVRRQHPKHAQGGRHAGRSVHRDRGTPHHRGPRAHRTRPARRRRRARRQRRLPLRPLAQERLRRHHARHRSSATRARARCVEVGAEVTKVKAGDRIIASFIPACGTCWFCLHDSSHLCDNEMAVMMSIRGKPARRQPVHGDDRARHVRRAMTCNESSIVKVDTDLPDEQLALIGCGVTTGVGAALNTAKVQPGSTVAVIGCGGVGQAVIQGARIAGASRIIAVDPVEMKRKTAEQLGATDFVDPSEGDPVAQVQQLTGGRGVDYAFEVIGLPETTLQAYNMIRKGGTAVDGRHDPRRGAGDDPDVRPVLQREDAEGQQVRLGSGAPRLPALHRPHRDGPPRHRRRWCRGRSSSTR